MVSLRYNTFTSPQRHRQLPRRPQTVAGCSVDVVTRLLEERWRGAVMSSTQTLLPCAGDLAGGNILLTSDDSQPHGFSCKVLYHSSKHSQAHCATSNDTAAVSVHLVDHQQAVSCPSTLEA